MSNFKKILGSWPNDTVLAEDLGVSVKAVRQMKYRNSVSSRHWLPLVRSAQSRGIDGVTLEALAATKEADA